MSAYIRICAYTSIYICIEHVCAQYTYMYTNACEDQSSHFLAVLEMWGCSIGIFILAQVRILLASASYPYFRGPGNVGT